MIGLWFVAGLLRMEWVSQPAAGNIQEFEGQRVTVHGTITGTPQIFAGLPGEWRVRYEVRLDRLIAGAADKLPHPVSGGILLNVRQKQPSAEGGVGDWITATGSVRGFHPYHNPGQVDWSAALAARGIDARISTTPEAVRIVRRDGMGSLTERLGRWRSEVRAALAVAMPEQDAALIMGMLFGGYDGIERQTVRDFAATGIVHILSVSGAHIALLAGAIFCLARRLSIPDVWSAGIAAAAMVGYGMISGFSAPVVRSVIMGLIAMAAIGLGLLASASRALLLATLGMLIYEPRNLFDISFQLSVGCTAGLLYLQPQLADWLKGVLPDWMTSGVAATLAAQLAVIPFLSWYFSMFPLISLVANLLVVPILEAVILWGLFSVLMAGGMTSLAHPLFVGVSLLTGLAVEINRFLAGLPGGSWNLPAMGVGFGCLYYGLLLWGAGCGERWGASPGRIYERIRRHPRVSVTFISVLMGIILVSSLWPGSMQVHFIDVGQGDATLVITPHGRSILVDAGGSLGVQNTFDIGERVVVPYLRHYGVNTLDWLILTHNHQDHAGGAGAVAEFIGARQVLLHQEGAEKSTAILQLKHAMQGKNLREADSVKEIHLDGVTVTLYQAGEKQTDENTKSKGGRSSSENGRSTVARIEYGRHSFLLTGDLEGDSETRIGKNDMRPSTVLKVGHHGSRKSTRSTFLERVGPQYAVISVGADNRFGHPAPETLHRLQEWPVSIYRTDRDGAVVFRSDGDTLTVERTVH